MPRSRQNILLNFQLKNEASRANLNKNKRIFTGRPFWNKVYRPIAANDHMVQNPPRASSLLFPHWDIKTKRPEPVKLDLPLFALQHGGFCTM